jgi:hypothetical protein
MNSSEFDLLLRSAGFDESVLEQHSDYDRPDTPPEDAIIFASQHIGPAPAHRSSEPAHPFASSDASIVLTETELLNWQSESIQTLIRQFQQELAQIDTFSSANSLGLENASPFAQRCQFFYAQLMGLWDAPADTAIRNFLHLINLKKLWMNHWLALASEGLAKSDRCCIVDGCPQIAIHGSNYCAWHMLDDNEQVFLRACPICGKPMVAKDEGQCADHLTNGTRLIVK